MLLYIDNFGYLLCQARHLALDHIFIVFFFLYIMVAFYKERSFSKVFSERINIFTIKGFEVYLMTSLIVAAISIALRLSKSLCN